MPIEGERSFFDGSVIKNPPAKAGDLSSIRGSGRSPGGGHGNPLQHSRLENPMDREVWWATVHGVTKSWTQRKRLSMHACTREIKIAWTRDIVMGLK